jgi:hypothetical protein
MEGDVFEKGHQMIKDRFIGLTNGSLLYRLDLCNSCHGTDELGVKND